MMLQVQKLKELGVTNSMNYGLILAGGVGQRMRSSGKPKQFLEVFGKPIIIYTLEKFDNCPEIDVIVIACNLGWTDYMNSLLQKYPFNKSIYIVNGGKTRQSSIQNGVSYIKSVEKDLDSIVVIHDGVRPLVQTRVISENISVAQQKGCCMTVKPVVESVVVTGNTVAEFDNIKKRDDTYSLTAPQSFKLSILARMFEKKRESDSPIPLLDAALTYTYMGGTIPLVIDNNHNIKVTTPEDFYILKAILELEENSAVFGLQ